MVLNDPCAATPPRVVIVRLLNTDERRRLAGVQILRQASPARVDEVHLGGIGRRDDVHECCDGPAVGLLGSGNLRGGLVEYGLHQLEQLLTPGRLAEETRGAVLPRQSLEFERLHSAVEHHGNVQRAEALPELLEDRQRSITAEARHVDVEQQEVGTGLPHLAAEPKPTLRCDHVIATVDQETLQEAPNHEVVIDDHDRWSIHVLYWCHHVLRLAYSARTTLQATRRAVPYRAGDSAGVDALTCRAMAELRRICVYCASSPGTNPTITDAARALAELLADEGLELVYGGGTVGLMGLIADTVMARGGTVRGVIPTQLFPREIAHRGLTELIEVSSMHERKTKMFEFADAFVALPGGFGTLEELAEVTTWAQLGIHAKPVGLLNVDGYYDGLLTWLRRAVDDQLLRADNRTLLLDAADAPTLLERMRAYEPSAAIKKWLDLNQS